MPASINNTIPSNSNIANLGIKLEELEGQLRLLGLAASNISNDAEAHAIQQSIIDMSRSVSAIYDNYEQLFYEKYSAA